MDKLTLCSIVGARPNFIKLAALSPEIRKVANEMILHTGQHYDYEMSKGFFDELNIPAPDFHTGVRAATHGEMTGRMLCKIERILQKNTPDAVIVYGDTNSTLAGALAAAKMHIPVVHIESGARSFDKRMPEEINRILVDHMSSLLFCATLTGFYNLSREGLPATQIYSRGDVLIDLMRDPRPVCLDDMEVMTEGDYYLLTIHREENTNISTLKQMFKGLLKACDGPFIFPCHPRTWKFLSDLDLDRKVKVIQPVGYFKMRELERNATRVITDSGGVQKEAYMLKVPCITLRNSTEWIETLDGNWNILTGSDPKKISDAFSVTPDPKHYHSMAFGTPGVCRTIARIIKEEIHG